MDVIFYVLCELLLLVSITSLFVIQKNSITGFMTKNSLIFKLYNIFKRFDIVAPSEYYGSEVVFLIYSFGMSLNYRNNTGPVLVRNK